MLASILASGLAVGAIYALIGITYNTMYATSRVMSFTAGQLGMLGGVLGSLFMLRLGLPLLPALVLTLAGAALLGVVTEYVAVRPVLKSLDQHLYVLSTLALALMVQQTAAILWSTEPQPFPRLVGLGEGVWDEKYWLPVLACAATILGLGFLYRRTLVGRAFLAVAEDNFAARALGLPERNLRDRQLCAGGRDRRAGRLRRRTAAAGLLRQRRAAELLRLRPGGARGLGNNRGAVIGGILLGLFQQAANFMVGGIFSSVAVFALFIIVLLAAPQGMFGAPAARRV
ncbi:branched-chain amino acid ABC transporter permease [Dankookia sp. P2]|uniref:branched-chain amino acid ABC transporter permease n=1 Tax=Dankookia sp. P2 TaxID=3423955 RepID=UPI003D67ACCD